MSALDILIGLYCIVPIGATVICFFLAFIMFFMMLFCDSFPHEAYYCALGAIVLTGLMMWAAGAAGDISDDAMGCQVVVICMGAPLWLAAAVLSSRFLSDPANVSCRGAYKTMNAISWLNGSIYASGPVFGLVAGIYKLIKCSPSRNALPRTRNIPSTPIYTPPPPPPYSPFAGNIGRPLPPNSPFAGSNVIITPRDDGSILLSLGTFPGSSVSNTPQLPPNIYRGPQRWADESIQPSLSTLTGSNVSNTPHLPNGPRSSRFAQLQRHTWTYISPPLPPIGNPNDDQDADSIAISETNSDVQEREHEP